MAIYSKGPGKIMFRPGYAAIVGFTLLLLPADAFACMPLVPLIHLFAGPAISYTGILGLIAGILAKSAMFALFARPLPFRMTFSSMLMANIFTTLLGLLFSLGAASPSPFFFIMLLIIAPVAYRPCKRAAMFLGDSRFSALIKANPVILALVFLILYILTFLFFGLTYDMEPPAYWPVKLLYVIVALLFTGGLTVIWEESIVFRHMKELYKDDCPKNFYPQVIAATVLILLLFMGIGAVLAIPARLASPNHLI